MAKDADVIIIGAGPAGYVAAIRAAQLGARVALVERDKLGGVCLNQGCIPTKCLTKSMEVLLEAKKASTFGVEVGKPRLDFQAMMAHKRAVVDKLVARLESLMKANEIKIIAGFGKVVGTGIVRVEREGVEELTADNIIIATGSSPDRLPIPGASLPGVLTSEELLEIGSPPTSLVIVGGGAVGVEFAGIFNALGARVTIIEMLPNLLPVFDVEIARRYHQLLRQRGVMVHLGARVESLESRGGELEVSFQAQGVPGSARGEMVLLATGRKPNVAGLNLEAVGVEMGGGNITVDEYLETNVEGLYAVGDVTGGLMLAHLASREGEVAAENALGAKQAMDYESVPNCIFSFPEIAGVGLTEQVARERGIAYRKTRFPFVANGRALTMDETVGVVKMICDEGGKLLGLHILGPHATELIVEGTLAMKLGATARDIASTIHAHPTLSEATREAALEHLDGAIHRV